MDVDDFESEHDPDKSNSKCGEASGKLNQLSYLCFHFLGMYKVIYNFINCHKDLKTSNNKYKKMRGMKACIIFWQYFSVSY